MSTPGNINAQWLSLPIAVLVLALVTTSVVCIARCTGVPCHPETETTKVPPCHKEKPSNPSESCKQSVLVVAADALTLTKPATVHFAAVSIPAINASLHTPALQTRVVPETDSPPGSSTFHFSVVLRI